MYNLIKVLFLISTIYAQTIIRRFFEPKLTQESTIQCDQVPFDFINAKPALQTTFDLPQSHYFIEVHLDLLLLGSWQGDQIQIYGDNSLLSSTTFTQTSFPTGQFCFLAIPNQISSLNFSFYHTSNNLTLKVLLLENSFTKEYPLQLGLRNIQINVQICHETCSTCSGPLDTDCRTCPTDGFKSRRTNRCYCPKAKEFVNENTCVTLCPRGKSPDSLNVCTPIANFQLYKESLTSSFNLEDWTMIGVEERKMTYQTKPMIGMFKEIERATLAFRQLPAHSSVVVRFTIFAFNIWAQGEFIKTIIGTVHQAPAVKTISGFSNTYDNTNCSSLAMVYCTSFVGEYFLSHSDSQIEIEIMSDTYPKSQAKWGISDFSLDLVLCSLNCLQCGDANKCIVCFENYFTYKGTCLEVCPYRSQLLDGRCIDYDETSHYLEVAFEKQQNFITNGGQYSNPSIQGLYINGFRIFGSVSKNLYIKRIYTDIKPHYKIRIMATLTFLNIQSSEYELLILIQKNIALNIKSDASQIVQTIELDQSIEHNSTDLKIQFIPSSYNQAKFGISNFIILAKKCYPTCLICSGVSMEQCTLWKLEPNFDKNTQICDLQQYFNVDKDECVQCSQSYCNTCLSQTKCIDCSQGYQLSGYECYCSQQYYWDKLNLQCQQCYPNCLSCNGPNIGDCLDLQQTFGDCWDGIWTPGEQCDDGNAISRDGCSDCIIDDGWSCINVENEPSLCYQCITNCVSCMNSTECLQCQIGYYYNYGFCQKCSYDCIDCLNQQFCKQCIVNNYQPIDGKCPICNAEKGYYILNNKCQSKCGDGIVVDEEEECDDGNQNNFDGCNQYCKVESNFTCNKTECNQNPDPSAKLEYADQTTNNIFHLQLENIDSNCKYVSATIEYFELNEFTLQVIDQNATIGIRCLLNFTYFKDISSINIIHVKIISLTPIKQRNLEDEIIINILMPPRYKQTYYNNNQQAQSQYLFDYYSIITKIIILCIPFALYLNAIHYYFNLLEYLMWVNYLYYLDINYPINIAVILKYNPFDYFTIPFIHHLDSLNISKQFMQLNINIFLKNIWLMLTYISITLFLILVIKLSKRYIYYLKNKAISQQKINDKLDIQNCLTFNGVEQNKQQQIKQTQISPNILQINQLNTPKNLPDSLTNNLVHDSPIKQIHKPKEIPYYLNQLLQIMIKVTLFMIYLFYLDLTFSSCFDILKISFNTQPYIIFNHILAILALCISILIINVLKNASKLHKIIQKKHMIYKYCYLLTHKEIGLNYFIIGTFRKLFYVLVLLLLYSSYQIWTIAICFMALILSESFQSIKLTQYSLSFILIDYSVLLLIILCAILGTNSQFELISTESTLIVGWIMIAVISLTIFILFLIFARTIINNLLKRIHSRKT